MAMIPTDQIDTVRHANDIVDVIRSYFNVQRAGSSFKALCPFHKEKTPSFIINPQRQIYHCFGCGAGGNVISFVMAYERVEFVTAVKMLAQKAGITLRFEENEKPTGPSKDLLYEIHENVTDYYHDKLLNSEEAKPVLSYLKKRNIDNDVIERFRIGYAPDSWDSVITWAQKKYSFALLDAAGLIQKSSKASASDHYYDRFRCRLMFPVSDEQGRVVAFSGRVLQATDKTGKYVNSPETQLFKKSRVLYAMDKARRAITDSGEALICEGQIDVIRCHMSGFENAVAALGTSFTDEHARIIKRFADSVTLVFDSDTAGKNSALRAAGVFAGADVAVKIAHLPENQDPDSLILKQGIEAFQKVLDEAVSSLDFQIDVLSERDDLTTEAGLIRALPPVMEMIKSAGSPVHQAHLLQRASERLGIPESALRKELSSRRYRVFRRGSEEKERNNTVQIPMKEQALLEHLVNEPGLISLVKEFLPTKMMSDENSSKILDILKKSDDYQNIAEILFKTEPENQQLTGLISKILSAPEKIKSEFTSHEESVQSLILGIRIDSIERDRQLILKKLKNLDRSDKNSDSTRQQQLLEAEFIQLGYDIAKHKSWDEALPVMEIT